MSHTQQTRVHRVAY